VSTFAAQNAATPFASHTNQYGDSNLPEVTLTAAGIAEDLGAQGRPLWKLSAYGPARGEPNLVVGKDVSPDELRVMAYQARAGGQDAAYAQHEQKLFGEADAAYRQLSANSNAAMQQALRNREEKKKQQQQQQQQQSQQQPQQQGSMQQGGSTAFGAAPPASSGFGASAFGAATPAPATSAFGAGTAPPAASAFGTSSTFGASTSAPSAQPAQPAATSAFGATSAPAAPASAFGQQSGSAFGAGSAFGGSGAFGTDKVQDPYKSDVPSRGDLTDTVIQAFESASFEWGLVPFIEPPIDVR
jgi:nucleoporin NUP42